MDGFAVDGFGVDGVWRGEFGWCGWRLVWMEFGGMEFGVRSLVWMEIGVDGASRRWSLVV